MFRRFAETRADGVFDVSAFLDQKNTRGADGTFLFVAWVLYILPA